MERLALFPLHTVLFPGAALPLHIFEPRYRQMIGECLETDAPFGVVLIRAGLEVGEPAVPHEVGTLAHIVQHERLEDGRMNLLATAGDRFRILELLTDRPYLSGRVELLPTDDGAAESFALAAALHLPHDQAQMLLELTSTPTRMRALAAMAEREKRLREHVGTTLPSTPTQVRRPSPN